MNELEASGYAVRAASDPQAIQRVMPSDDFSEPIRRAALESLEAHLAFFCFEDLFPDPEWVITRFAELEPSRNIVAHNSTLESTNGIL